MPQHHETNWSFAATSAASSDACSRAEGWARDTGLPEAQILRLVLVIEELFTNTIKHGYREESNRPVHIALGHCDGLAELDYRDQAPPFDPIHTVETLPEDIPPTQVGGMGLRLIQTLGCNASYTNEGGWNIVRLAVGAKATSPQMESLINRNKQKKQHRQKNPKQD